MSFDLSRFMTTVVLLAVLLSATCTEAASFEDRVCAGFCQKVKCGKASWCRLMHPDLDDIE